MIDYLSYRSHAFVDFISLALVKDPAMRASPTALLKVLPFIFHIVLLLNVFLIAFFSSIMFL